MSNFATIWHEVRLGIGKRLDIDDEIKAAVNDAVIDLTMTFRIRQAVYGEEFDTVSGTNAYELNSTCLDVIDVRNETETTMLSPGDFLDFGNQDYEDSDSFGEPSLWFVKGTELYLYSNTPGDDGYVITYRYVRRFAAMSGDDDLFPLPREWERPSKLLAKSYIFELLGQNEKAIAAPIMAGRP